ncbi:soluble inorganic pyrophosphatase 6, chloroplastic-like [Coffea arabica]|uniref:inorganic diphosphatase n=1 Tax=Coffea arabica TaxID=13443 RepID=A0A6P6W1P3_COFAR|nr:soluble inorganic pyrophosphatase 6, chloroplastic-like [Coffea arabica]
MVAAGVMVSLIPGIGSTWPLTKSPFFRRSSTISLRFISENTKRLEQQGHAIRRNFNHPGYQIQEEGQVDSHDYRVFLLDNTGKKISPWHDIPLHVGNGVFNFVAEISKDSNLRMELATDELYTPLKQDKIRGRIW